MLCNYNLVKYSLSNDNKLRVSMAVLDRGVLCYNFIIPLLYTDTDAYKNWHPNLDFDYEYEYEYCGVLRPTKGVEIGHSINKEWAFCDS